MKLKIFIILLLTIACFAQIDTENIEVLGIYKTGYINSVHINSNLCFVGYDCGKVHIVDISDKYNPQKLSEFDITTEISDILIYENYLLVSAYEDGLHFVDISNPEAPVVLLSLPGNVQDAFISENLLFLADFDISLNIYDISNPASPELLSSYNTETYRPNGIFVRDSIAFLSGGDLHILNVANPESPFEISSLAVYGKVTYATDSLCYVGNNIINISDITSPSFVLRGTDWNFTIVDDLFAYNTNTSNRNGISIIHIGRPTAPYEYSHIEPGGEVIDIALENNCLFVVDERQGLYIYDVTQPIAPFNTSIYSVSYRGASSIEFFEHYGLFAGSAGIRVMDISDPANIQEQAIIRDGYTPHLLVLDNYLLAFCHDYYYGEDDKLKCYDLSDPLTPVLIQEIIFGEDTEVRDVYLKDRYLTISFTNYQQVVYYIRETGELELLANYDLPNDTPLHFFGDLAFQIYDHDNIKIYDFTDITSPALIGYYDFDIWWYDTDYYGDITHGEQVYSLTYIDSTIYCSCSDDIMRTLDISDAYNPVFEESFSFPSLYNMNVHDHYLYTIQSSDGVIVYEFDSTTNLNEVGHFRYEPQSHNDRPLSLFFNDSIAASVGRNGSIYFLDISEFSDTIPDNPPAPLDTAFSALNIYPNPIFGFGNSVNIELPENTSKLFIYNIDGRLCYSTDIISNYNSTYTWQPLDNTPSGVYYIKSLSENNNIQTGKIVYIK